MKSKRKKFWSGDNRRVTSVLRVKFGPDFESISCNKRLTAIRHNFAEALNPQNLQRRKTGNYSQATLKGESA
jgi:hypothetical protein